MSIAYISQTMQRTFHQILFHINIETFRRKTTDVPIEIVFTRFRILFFTSIHHNLFTNFEQRLDSRITIVLFLYKLGVSPRLELPETLLLPGPQRHVTFKSFSVGERSHGGLQQTRKVFIFR